jgi:hypothetical protein
MLSLAGHSVMTGCALHVAHGPRCAHVLYSMACQAVHLTICWGGQCQMLTLVAS